MLHSLFASMNISASGLSTQRTRINTISQNIANVDTTRTPDGTPYRRKIAMVASGQKGKKFSEIFFDNKLAMDKTSPNHKNDKPFREPNNTNLDGVHVDKIVQDSSPFRMIYDPSNPDADKNGYVAKPNVNIVQEMTELITATRSYEANVTAINSSKEMIKKALLI